MPGIGQSGASPVPHADSLGVIISLPAALAAEISARRAVYQGPDAAVVPPHITLVSGRTTDTWEKAAEHVRSVAATAAPFVISLRGTGTFEPVSPVVYLNVARGGAECTELHEQLLAGPLEHLLEFDFLPHLTVAHDLDEPAMTLAKSEMATFNADFEVGSIGLFDHLGGGWELREELSLGGGKPA
ncbi:2'-5' RNA ligase family protein [Arthrobacter glacialis]|uniref:2'-5' RNA ligase family protein n=1 Tax=Arthrobacter glacialis TaxID=1664 RepID=UPI0013FD86D3|nr:2'-5' RNA ligase family protein [Arthrobacter glacialis]